MESEYKHLRIYKLIVLGVIALIVAGFYFSNKESHANEDTATPNKIESADLAE